MQIVKLAEQEVRESLDFCSLFEALAEGFKGIEVNRGVRAETRSPFAKRWGMQWRMPLLLTLCTGGQGRAGWGR